MAENEGGPVLNPLELFFDLVFVFAFTQITAFLSDHSSWLWVVQGAILLAALWRTWTKYSWLTVTIPVERVLAERVLILAATATTFVLAISIRGAFDETAILFGTAYFLINGLHFGLSAIATQSETRKRVLSLLPGLLGGPALVFAAGFVEQPWRLIFWVLGIAVDYAMPAIRGVPAVELNTVHFVERYRHIVIIALGETILAMGFSVSSDELRLPPELLLTVLLGITLIAALGWLYFDYVTLASERRFEAAEGYERNVLARDSYLYLHLPLVAGIIFIAFGLEETLTHVEAPLRVIPAAALCGGAALYLLGHTAFWLRDIGRLSVPRLAVAGLAIAVIPLAMQVSALTALAALTTLFGGLAVLETIFAPVRGSLRED